MTHARNVAVGAFGERIAADHLRSLGMVILDRNYRCRYGEIDIVARDGSTLVVCEVKTRTSTAYGTPAEAISPVKASRLRRLAAHWIESIGLEPPSLRIDVISVVVPDKGAPHVEQISGVA